MGLGYYWSTKRKRSANAKNRWNAYVILRLGVEPSLRACYPHSLLWYSRHTYCRYTNGGLDVGGLNMGLNRYVGDKLRWDVCIFIHPFHTPQTMLWIRSKRKGLLRWRVTTTKIKDDNQKIYHEKIKFKLSVWESNPVFGRTDLIPIETVAHVLPVYERRVGCGRVHAGLEQWEVGVLWFPIGWAVASTSVHDWVDGGLDKLWRVVCIFRDMFTHSTCPKLGLLC